MRILLINHFPLAGSGSGVYTANIANSLIALGHEVACVYPTNLVDQAKYAFKACPVYFVDDQGNAPVPDALPFNFPCFTTHPKSVNTFEALSDEQLEMYLDAFRKTIGSVVEEFRPDVIHSGHVWLLAELGGEFGIPLVITAHGTDLIGYKSSDRYRANALAAARKAAAIIAISKQSCAEVVETFPFAADKTCLISNGYDANVFNRITVTRKEVLEGFGIEDRFEHVVGFAGKFTRFKGIDVLLKAAAVYEDENTATVLAGDGELFDEMNQLACDLELKNVYFIHNQTHENLRRLYNIVDVGLVPSRKEPFGLVAIEAGACGAPVIGTNDGGIVDILVDKTGILIPVDDSQALADAVLSVLSGRRTYDREEVAAYTKEHFSQDQFTRRMVEEVYEAALKR